MSQTYHKLKVENIKLSIGPYFIKSLSTAAFGLDGGAMFGTVPKVLWSKTNPSDDENKILMDCRCLLLVSDDKKILIDTGLGGDFVEKYGLKMGLNFYAHYNIKKGEDSGIIKALEKQALQTTDITDVILTHLHFDHAGGATKSIDGKIIPTFENATYYIQKENLEVAKNPNLREKASYYSCNFEPLIEHNCLKVLNGSEDLFKNIRLSITHGHTQGQQTVWIDDGSTSLLYCADLIPTATHVRLPWVMGYDLEPLKLIEERD